MSNIRLASPIQFDSIVDGPGIRTVIWTQGCPHNCLGCHNPNTHDFNQGQVYEIKDILEELSNIDNQDGVTFSGGDPFMQVNACLEIAMYFKKKSMDIWCYTGFLFEDLLKMSEEKPIILEFLNQIDVLVDGKFILEFKTYDAIYRGSSNQRLIDTKRSLKEGKTVLFEVSNKEINRIKDEFIFI